MSQKEDTMCPNSLKPIDSSMLQMRRGETVAWCHACKRYAPCEAGKYLDHEVKHENV